MVDNYYIISLSQRQTFNPLKKDTDDDQDSKKMVAV